MTDRKVQALRKDGKINQANLVELGMHPDLEGFVVLCKWKDGSYSTGASDMDDRDLAYTTMLLTHEVTADLFEDEYP